MNIYIHIPFCHSKCAYCAFLSHCDQSKEDLYIEAVCKEINQRKLEISEPITTIYFGGGTPSLIKPSNLKKILEMLKDITTISKNYEITLETNPEDINKAKLMAWEKIGINRISIGVQSLNDTTRKIIKRKLTAEEVVSTIILTKNYFQNISIDLISGLPDETTTALMETLEIITKLDVCHISLYDLEINNDSLIGKNPNQYRLPKEDLSISMLTSAWESLKKFGYEQYEISNFAKPNKFCRHNQDFWDGKDYLGFGLGASSKKDRQIMTNCTNFDNYLNNKNHQTIENLTYTEDCNMKLFTSLRLNKPFKESLLLATKSEVIKNDLIKNELVTDNYTLTTKGKLLHNQIYDILVNN